MKLCDKEKKMEGFLRNLLSEIAKEQFQINNKLVQYFFSLSLKLAKTDDFHYTSESESVH